MSSARKFRPGVLWGDEVTELFKYANDNNFAIPAVNVIGTNSINAVLETAREVNSPVIIQFSNGGASFNAGKGLSNDGQKAAILGGPWIDGLLEAGENFYKSRGFPLYSSHMLDLSEEPIEENVEICAKYHERMSKIGMTIEIELGVTGGEEDGVDNSDVDSSKLYTQPDEVSYAYEKLNAISDKFTIAAAFGNVHGVYRPGNVELRPVILKNSQDFVKEKFSTGDNPINFVFHGGSGSTVEEIREAIGYGVIKMNIDTDMQYAFMSGVRDYIQEKKDYLQSQIGNPDGDDIPNKKYYDPRKWLREGEHVFVERLKKAFEDLNNVNTL